MAYVLAEACIGLLESHELINLFVSKSVSLILARVTSRFRVKNVLEVER